jgi:hypothetical protein
MAHNATTINENGICWQYAVARRLVQRSSTLLALESPWMSLTRDAQQDEFLLRMYQAEFAKDPSSRATKSSRSNLMALRHTMKQMYGEAVASGVANLV